jgi:hypothetical protein
MQLTALITITTIVLFLDHFWEELVGALHLAFGLGLMLLLILCLLIREILSNWKIKNNCIDTIEETAIELLDR